MVCGHFACSFGIDGDNKRALVALFCHNSCNLSTGQALSEPVGTYNKTQDMATCDDDDPIADAFDDSLPYSYDGDDDGFWVDGDTKNEVRRMCRII